MARAQKKVSQKLGYAEDPQLVAMHPGPGPDFQFPAKPMEAPEARLARLERSFLERSLANALDRPSGLRGDAATIIALRAELGQ